MNSSKAILSANGGVHSKRAMKKVKDRLQNHGMKRAILVHFVITGSQKVKVYRDTYNDIADHIRDNGSRCEYFGCLEMDEVKGLHAHAYFVIETSKKFPHKTLDVTDGAWLHKLAERRGLVNDDGTTRRIHIAQPQNKMHDSNGKKQFFARLDTEAKLANCLERVEYLYKNRSKANVPCREIYFNSNFEANKAKRVRKVIDSPSAPKAEREVVAIQSDSKPLQGDSKPSEWVGIKIMPEPHQGPFNAFETHYNDKGIYEERIETDERIEAQYPTIKQGRECSSLSKAASTRYEDGSGASTPHRKEGIEVRLTPAETYVATQYESAVDQRLDVEALRLFLLEQGIKRTPAQVAWELEEKYGFLGYASRYPAPAKPDTGMLDALIDRTPLKSVRHNRSMYVSDGKPC